MAQRRINIRRAGLDETLSNLDIQKLNRCRSPSISQQTNALRTKLFQLQDESIKQHLAIICKCYIARKLNQNDLRVQYNYGFVIDEIQTLEKMTHSLQTVYPGTFGRKFSFGVKNLSFYSKSVLENLRLPL